ncbi:hypothetical protein [Citrobacter sp. FDAARGOS_156]|uniref:hypothetical protein n=1 Tax=Citrobacter sp. FDAARGOS_156 TaxID=1702170 RepID=UPI000AF30937
MVHGGLRYIEQGNLGLVRHSLLERQRMRRNARHLVQRLPFYSRYSIKMAYSTSGCLLHLKACSGPTTLREDGGKASFTKNLPLRKCCRIARRSRRTAIRWFMYFDARVDDARLTLALVRTAAFHGAVVTNHAEVIETTRDQHGKVNGPSSVPMAEKFRSTRGLPSWRRASGCVTGMAEKR